MTRGFSYVAVYDGAKEFCYPSGITPPPSSLTNEPMLEFEMQWDTEDGSFSSIQSAYFGNSPLAIFVTDGEGHGLDADWVVTKFSRSEPLEEALTVSVTCRPTLINRAPEWR